MSHSVITDHAITLGETPQPSQLCVSTDGNGVMSWEGSRACGHYVWSLLHSTVL